MTTKQISLYKNIPAVINIEKARYYPYSQQIITDSSKTLDINLSLFEGLNYSFNDEHNKIVLDEKELWNGHAFPGCERLLAPYSDGSKTIYNNITTVGNLYINNGIAKGFSVNNYITIDNKTISDISQFELLTKIKIDDSLKDDSPIVCKSDAIQDLFISNDKKLSIWDGSTYFGGSTILNTTDWYWVKIVLVDNTYRAYLLKDENYTISTLPEINEWSLEFTTTSNIWSGSILNIGRGVLSRNQFFYGSIDILQTYIKVNDEIFLQVEETTVPDIPNYLTNVGKLVYNVVGNPTIESDVVSNFSSSNYITTDYTFLPNNYSWAWQVKFMQTESYSSDVQYIMCSSYYNAAPYITILADGTVNASLSTNGSWLAGVGTSTFTVELNKYYWLRLAFDGVNTYSLKYSTDGQNYFLIGEVQNTSLIVSTDKLWFGKSGHNSHLHGTIDLNETFVEVNNKVVWGKYAPFAVINGTGCLDNITDITTERTLSAFVKDNSDDVLLSESDDDKIGYTWANTVTIPQHEVVPIYKENYNVVGSISYDTDFNASGFSASNYLKSKDGFKTNDYSSWSIETKVKLNELNRYQYWCHGPVLFGLDNSNKIHVWLNNYEIVSSNTLAANTWYYVKLGFTGEAMKLYYKTNEADSWTECGSLNVAAAPESEDFIYVGINLNNTEEYLYGSIDMKAYKIYGNGVLINELLERR